MPWKEWGLKLIEKGALAIIGAMVLIVGAAGGVSKLGLTIPSGLPQWTVMALGLVTAVVGLVLAVREVNRIDRELKKNYGITITYPHEGAPVSGEVELSGTYKHQPSDGVVRVLQYNPRQRQFWPKHTLTFDPRNKTWRCIVPIGDEPGETILMVVAAGADARILLDYARKVFQPGDPWPGIDKLPTDVRELARVGVRRT
jgi:hypothetical protein